LPPPPASFLLDNGIVKMFCEGFGKISKTILFSSSMAKELLIIALEAVSVFSPLSAATTAV